jgi:hypothetical protein
MDLFLGHVRHTWGRRRHGWQQPDVDRGRIDHALPSRFGLVRLKRGCCFAYLNGRILGRLLQPESILYSTEFKRSGAAIHTLHILPNIILMVIIADKNTVPHWMLVAQKSRLVGKVLEKQLKYIVFPWPSPLRAQVTRCVRPSLTVEKALV